jgi:hypothetical protein
MAWSSDWCGVCHGAHFGEGPVLVGPLRGPTLFMLARKSALRVAPGGSAPLFPSVTRRGSGGARSGRESRPADRTGKWVFRDPIDNVTRRREHPGEAMPGPLGSIPG